MDLGHIVEMTALQFAQHNELDETVNLNVLGKIAKAMAGDTYATIPHIKYGQVGYLPIRTWMAAYDEYMSNKPNTIFDYVVRKDLEGYTKTERYAIERIAENLVSELRLPRLLSSKTSKRHPAGIPMFEQDIIETAIERFLLLENAHFNYLYYMEN